MSTATKHRPPIMWQRKDGLTEEQIKARKELIATSFADIYSAVPQKALCALLRKCLPGINYTGTGKGDMWKDIATAIHDGAVSSARLDKDRLVLGLNKLRGHEERYRRDTADLMRTL
jgi:hypothetical protein